MAHADVAEKIGRGRTVAVLGRDATAASIHHLVYLLRHWLVHSNHVTTQIIRNGTTVTVIFLKDGPDWLLL